MLLFHMHLVYNITHKSSSYYWLPIVDYQSLSEAANHEVTYVPH